MLSIMEDLNHNLFMNKRLFIAINEMDILLSSLNFSTSMVSGFIFIIKWRIQVEELIRCQYNCHT